MDTAQIAEELRELSDRLDRAEASDDALTARINALIERAIPSSVAGVQHQVNGTDVLIANLAGTVESLAVTLGTVADRLTLLERRWE